MSMDEWIVIAAVILGLFVFEMGPKLLNIVKNRRVAKETKNGKK